MLGFMLDVVPRDLGNVSTVRPTRVATARGGEH